MNHYPLETMSQTWRVSVVEISTMLTSGQEVPEERNRLGILFNMDRLGLIPGPCAEFGVWEVEYKFLKQTELREQR